MNDLPVPAPPPAPSNAVVSAPAPPGAEPPVPAASVPHPPAPQTLVCANCGASLGGEYCTACGQRHEPHVHTLGHFAGEAFESLSHADSRLWRTLLYLLTKPGFLTREFFEGRRVRYLPAFRLYLVISVIFFLVIGMDDGEDVKGVDLVKLDTPAEIAQVNELADRFDSKELGVVTDEQGAKVAAELRAIAARQAAAIEARKGAADPDRDVDINLRTGEGVENGISQFCADFAAGDAKDPKPQDARRKSVTRWCKRFDERGASAIGEAVAHNIPRAMFIFLPLLALCMKLMYWRPKRYYVEHLLFLVHNQTFVFLVASIVMLIGMIPGVGDYAWPLYWAAFFYMAWYIYRGMRNVYQQGRGLTLVKYFALGWLYYFAAFAVFLLTAIYSAMTF